jgi:preprotein translocase subunit SecY
LVPVGGTFAYYAAVVPAFVAGALAVAWLADEMTNRGLGQGTSVMITMSVCGAYWSAAKYHWAAICSATWATAWPFVAAALALTAGSVLVQSGTCRVPLAYFQGPTVPGLPRVVREEVDHVPFKINPLGMQPVLVAVFLCEGACWLAKNAGAGEGVVNALRAALTASGGCPGLYYCVFFLIVFGFSYLDLQDTPKEVSEYLVKIGARIPDVRPGEATVAHLAAMQSGARFFGGASLGVVAVACAAADEWTRQTAGVCVGFTSMLIVTSTILQLKRQVVAMGQMPKLDQVIASV